ncbi:DNA replication and repair protein RecO [Spirosomataceae bacterium TFI 002]|nr:DNA replication and repair protein RecO [Spirosomataceae bacterium TFI 002]
MLHKTKGIVLSYVPYRETSIVVKIYTEKFGIQGYIENGVRSARGKNKIALFQPLTLLELVVYHNEKKDLHRISEIKCPNALQHIPFEIKKTTIGIFINEILSKTLKESIDNEELFFFLYQAILTFDTLENEVENFHLKFLMKLSAYLGFAPQSAKEIKNQFYEAGINLPIESNTVEYLDKLIKSNWEDPLVMNNNFRSHLLDIFLNFYQLHLEEFKNIKSIAVLADVLH